MDWIVSAIALWSKWLVGNKNSNGWLLSIVNQFFWIYIVVTRDLWGLLPIGIVSMWMGIRNYFLWTRHDRIKLINARLSRINPTKDRY